MTWYRAYRTGTLWCLPTTRGKSGEFGKAASSDLRGTLKRLLIKLSTVRTPVVITTLKNRTAINPAAQPFIDLAREAAKPTANWLMSPCGRRADNICSYRAFRILPSRPGEFHPEPLTEPDLTLSRHPARATARRLPPFIEHRVPPVAG